MNHLRPILEQAERTAVSLNLSLEQVSGFGDGTYRVEFKERDQGSRPVKGFQDGHDAKGAVSNTAQQRGSRDKRNARQGKTNRPAGRR